MNAQIDSDGLAAEKYEIILEDWIFHLSGILINVCRDDVAGGYCDKELRRANLWSAWAIKILCKQNYTHVFNPHHPKTCTVYLFSFCFSDEVIKTNDELLGESTDIRHSQLTPDLPSTYWSGSGDIIFTMPHRTSVRDVKSCLQAIFGLQLGRPYSWVLILARRKKRLFRVLRSRMFSYIVYCRARLVIIKFRRPRDRLPGAVLPRNRHPMVDCLREKRRKFYSTWAVNPGSRDV